MKKHRKFYLKKLPFDRRISYSERTDSSELFPPGLILSDRYAFFIIQAAVATWRPLRIKRNL